MPRSTHIVSVNLNFVLCLLALLIATTKAYNPFVSAATPRAPTGKPKLILIGGCPGTGKSTFGMSVALDQGILKCISTDTVRAVMRSFVAKEVSPALHRSSYAPAFEDDNPVRSWKETCLVLQPSVEGLVDDAINRRVSLVVEGVHVMPSNDLIKKWQDAGGVALGVLLQVQNPTTHKKLLKRRGFTTGNIDAEEKKINSYSRIRDIQDEMMKMADEARWLRIEQKTEPDPLEQVTAHLMGFSVDNISNGRQQVIFSGQPISDSKSSPTPILVDDEMAQHIAEQHVDGGDTIGEPPKEEVVGSC